MRYLVHPVCYRGNINGTYKMTQNMQDGTISEFYADDKKPSSNPNDILKSAKNFCTKETNVKSCHC